MAGLLRLTRPIPDYDLALLIAVERRSCLRNRQSTQHGNGGDLRVGAPIRNRRRQFPTDVRPAGSQPSDLKFFRYHLRYVVDEQPYVLNGLKVLSNAPGFDAWHDTSTLYFEASRGRVAGSVGFFAYRWTPFSADSCPAWRSPVPPMPPGRVGRWRRSISTSLVRWLKSTSSARMRSAMHSSNL